MERDVDIRNSDDLRSTPSSESEYSWHEDADETLFPDGVKPRREGMFFNEEEERSCSRTEFLAGKDIQGIDWTLQPQTRENIRAHRLAVYDNYLNLPEEVQEHAHTIQQHIDDVAQGSNYYQFEGFQRHEKHTILHFQLRNLLWATSAYDFYYPSQNVITRYNLLSRETEDELSLQQPDTKIGKINGNILVTTICVAHGLIAVGGFYGEMVMKKIGGEVIFGESVSSTPLGLTNGLEIFQSGSGQLKLLASNNDHLVRMFDVEDFRKRRLYPVPWPANWTAASPDGGKLLAVVGDDPDALILDSNSGERVAELKGHLDYSFAAAWHPSGHQLATGNQDTTTRIWDIRMTRESLHILVGKMAAIRSLRYSANGRFLAASEAADFVHIYDASVEYTAEQEIDMFGEICGISFTPDDSRLMTSIQEESFGGFLLHKRSPDIFYG